VVAVLLTGLVTQVGKTVVFPDWRRPPHVFAGSPLIEIVHPHPPGSRSFPSGHATSIATGGVFFAYFLGQWRKWLIPVIGVFTVALCFTRVIIGVHFPGDIFVGSIIGSVGGLLILQYMTPLFRKRTARFQRPENARWNQVVMGVAVAAIIGQFIQLIVNT
ncbi:MAG: phosphatase PAP2 family protein, partial [Bacteroidota bacterium]